MFERKRCDATWHEELQAAARLDCLHASFCHRGVKSHKDHGTSRFSKGKQKNNAQKLQKGVDIKMLCTLVC